MHAVTPFPPVCGHCFELSSKLAGRDMRPAAHSLSFASPKESKQRKASRIRCPLSTRGSLRCSRTGGAFPQTRSGYRPQTVRESRRGTAPTPVRCAPQRRIRERVFGSLRIASRGLVQTRGPGRRPALRDDAQRVETCCPYAALRSGASWGRSGMAATFTHCLRLVPGPSLRESPPSL